MRGQLNITYPSKVISKFSQRPRSCVECRIWLVIDDWALILKHIMPAFSRSSLLHSITVRHQSAVTMAISFENRLILVGSQHVLSTPFTFHVALTLVTTQCFCLSKTPQEFWAQYSALTTIITWLSMNYITASQP